MISRVESAPPILSQGSEPDVLLRLVPSGVSVVSAPSLGGLDEGLARISQCAVEGAFSQWVRFPPGNYRSSR